MIYLHHLHWLDSPNHFDLDHGEMHPLRKTRNRDIYSERIYGRKP